MPKEFETGQIYDNPAMAELLASETKYNRFLTNLLDVINRTTGHTMLKPMADQLGNLKRVSDELIKHLAKLGDPELPPETLDTLRKERIGILKLFYSHYKNYTPMFEQFMQEVADRPGVFKPLDDAAHGFERQSLDSILAMPMQRGPRYILLLKEIIGREENARQKGNKAVLTDEQLTVTKENLAACQKAMMDANNTMVTYNPDENEVTIQAYQFGDYTYAAVSAVTRALVSAVGFFTPERDNSNKGAPVVIHPQPRALHEDDFIVLGEGGENTSDDSDEYYQPEESAEVADSDKPKGTNP